MDMRGIALVMATSLEADPLIKGLGLKKREKHPFALYGKDDILLVLSGIGKANAAMAAAHCLSRHDPDWICNLGAAGALDRRHPLGELYQIDRVLDYDRPSLITGKPHQHKTRLLDGFQTALLATQDRPIYKPEERERMSRDANLCDMEGAAVAQACALFGKKAVLFKFVSDTPDQSRSRDIIANILRYRSTAIEYFIETALKAMRDSS